MQSQKQPNFQPLVQKSLVERVHVFKQMITFSDQTFKQNNKLHILKYDHVEKQHDTVPKIIANRRLFTAAVRPLMYDLSRRRNLKSQLKFPSISKAVHFCKIIDKINLACSRCSSEIFQRSNYLV